MALQTAGQASQAQPKTYTLDSLPTASPAATPGAYYNGYPGEAGPNPSFGQSMYPGHQLPSSQPTPQNFYKPEDQATSAKGQYNNAGPTSRLDPSQLQQQHQQQHQQHDAMAALMMQASPRKSSDMIYEQRLRTNSLGQVSPRVSNELPESRLRANSHDPTEEMRFRAQLQEQKMRGMEQMAFQQQQQQHIHQQQQQHQHHQQQLHQQINQQQQQQQHLQQSQMHHQPQHPMMPSPHRNSSHSNNPSYSHLSIPPQPLPAGVYHNNSSTASPVKAPSQPPSLHNTPIKNLHSMKPSSQEDQLNLVSPIKHSQMLPPPSMGHLQPTNQTPSIHPPQPANHPSQPPNFPHQPMHHKPQNPLPSHLPHLTITPPNPSQEATNIAHQSPQISPITKKPYFQNRSLHSPTPQPITTQPSSVSISLPVDSSHFDHPDRNEINKSSNENSIVNQPDPVPVDIPLQLNISSNPLTSPKKSPTEDHFIRSSAGQLISPALSQRSPHQTSFVSPRNDSNPLKSGPPSKQVQYSSPSPSKALDPSSSTPPMKTQRSMSPVITPLSIVEEEEQCLDETKEEKENAIQQEDQVKETQKDDSTVQDHPPEIYTKHNKPLLHRMISAPDDRDLNIHMQRRYTISDTNDVQIAINAASKINLQLSPSDKHHNSDDEDLAMPLKSHQSAADKSCISPSISHILPLPAMGLKRKIPQDLDDVKKTPQKYIRPCDYNKDDADAPGNQNNDLQAANLKPNGTLGEPRDAIAVPTVAQQELQSAAFRSRLDSMISHYDSSQNNGNLLPEDKTVLPSTPDECSADKSCPSSLQPTPVKDANDSSYFGQTRPLNYELSSPKATIDAFRYPSSSEPLTPPSDDELDIDNPMMDSPPAYKRQIDQNGREQYYCHLCDFIGGEKNQFNLHMNSHFEHSCTQCDYMSRTEGRLKRHIKDFHCESLSENFNSTNDISPTDNALESLEKSSSALCQVKMSPDNPANSHSNGLLNGSTLPINGMHLLEAKRESGRQKLFRCRHCEFCSSTKVEFWEHSRTHIKDDKILQCPKCPFVTEYKHHLEYHLRNHFGSKPFRCNKCNYACVNKSMLNSHMKSHTNVYQYRCADCTYATKYCHSLKLHLRKYQHRAATVLNADGSLPVDGSGDFDLVSKRGPPRGPRGLRRDSICSSGRSPPPPPLSAGNALAPHEINNMAVAAVSAMFNQPGRPNGQHPTMPPTSLNNGQIPTNKPTNLPPLHNGAPNGLMAANFWAMMGQTNGMNGILPPGLPMMHPANSNGNHHMPPHLKPFENTALNNMQNQAQMIRPPHLMPGFRDDRPINGIDPMQKSQDSLHCSLCGINADSKKQLSIHMVKVHSTENHDLLGMFGIKPESLNHEDSAKLCKTESSVVSSHQQVAKLLQQRPPASQFAPKNDWPYVKSEIDVLDLTSKRSLEDINDGEIQSPMKRKMSSDSNVSDNTLINRVSLEPSNGRRRSRKGKAYKLNSHELSKDHGDDSANEDEERRPSSVGDQVINKPSQHIGDLVKIDEQREIENFRPRSKSFAMISMHQRLSDSKYLHDPSNTANHMLSSNPSATNNAPVTATVAPQLSSKIDPCQAYSLGMSRRKLFMMQQMEDQRGENENSESTANHLTESAPSANEIQSGGVVDELNTKSSITPAAAANDDSSLSDFTSNPSQYATSEKPCESVSATSSGASGAMSNRSFECQHCDIMFGDCVMYTMHMGYHGFHNPLKCNMCGYSSSDKVDFFLHIARIAHA